jgi:hypothetical protein
LYMYVTEEGQPKTYTSLGFILSEHHIECCLPDGGDRPRTG